MSASSFRVGLDAFRKNASGATAVEFALIIPVFIMLVFGIAQFAYSQHCASSLHFALRAASRSLMLNPDLTEQQLEVQVREALEDLGDSGVEVKMTIVEDANRRTAKIVGIYNPSVTIPLVGNMPITYRSSVSTILQSEEN